MTPHITSRSLISRRFYRCAAEALEPRIALSVATGSPDQAFAAGDIAPPVAVPLHHTSYPGGVTVTDTQIITETEIIPRFGAQPTNTALRSGLWSDPSIWSANRIPQANDRVSIAAGATVRYMSLSNERLEAVEISGTLTFATTTDTRLTVGTMTVMPTGSLLIGTAARPIVSPLATAELVIADRPLDPVKDPRQYGTGLIVLGTISIRGTASDETWTRLAVEPRAGDMELVLDHEITGWKAGDTLLVPDTRQVATSDSTKFSEGQLPQQWEEMMIRQIEGRRAILWLPLRHDHLGARNVDGGLELLPHVALLNRSVVVRSENPAGTRGHVFFNARANVDIEFARFKDLGRTDAMRPLDNTTFDASGNMTHFGTNQIGRYALHFHHLMGPENPTNTGYQFQFVGNTIDGSKRWGVAVHDSSFGNVSKNVIYGAQGAGFVTEDGSEIGNVFDRNITMRIQGTFVDGKDGTQEGDFARGGSGFWFRRGGNTITNNVAVASTYAGFMLDGYFSFDPVMLPNFRGADKHEPGQGTATKVNPAAAFSNNEAYGLSSIGLWAAYISGDNLADGQPTTIISGLRLWNVMTAGVVAYHTSNVTFDNLLILGDYAAQNHAASGTYGMYLRTYENRNLVVRNSRIEGMRTGIVTPGNDASQPGIERPTIIQNSTLKNYINILVSSPQTNRPSAGNALEVRDVKFHLITSLPPGATGGVYDPPANIQMKVYGETPDLTQPSVVHVYNYNQVAGDNFRVLYREQAINYVMPTTDPSILGTRGDGLIGSFVPGLTNVLNWMRYSLALAGSVAPVTAGASRGEINGLIAPFLVATTPKVVIVTPWQDASVEGGGAFVRLRYNVVGALPNGTQVYFSLDNGPAFTNFKDGGLFNVPMGQHTLRAYIGNASGQLLAGTSIVERRFSVTGMVTPLATTAESDAITSAISTALAATATSYATIQTTIGAPSSSTPAATQTSAAQSPPAGDFGSHLAAGLKRLAAGIESLSQSGSLPDLSDAGEIDEDLLAQLAQAVSANR